MWQPVDLRWDLQRREGPGEGVTTALLRREGVLVFSELELEDAQRALEGMGH